MRWIFLLISIFLVACSNPRDNLLPKDLSQMESVKPAIDKLTSTEKELLMAYVMRHTLGPTLGHAFGMKTGPIPEGMTIGKAIEEQRKWVAEISAKEEAEKALREKLQAELEQALKKMRDAVTVTLISKRIKANRGHGGIIFDEKFVIQVGYKNNTEKEIAGIKGKLVIQDLFGDELSTFQISNDDGIKVGGTKIWTGSRSISFSLGNNQDRKLSELTEDKYKVIWEPQTIVFSDGTSLKAPESFENGR